jgi:gliding motility-associated lipoprotein GldH
MSLKKRKNKCSTFYNSKEGTLKQLLTLLSLVILASCEFTPGVFEKNVAIPKHEWSSSFQPEIKVEIKDTVAVHQLYVVVRHTNAYRYNNLWVNLYTSVPGEKERKQRFDLRLATDDKGWLGSGMDDIFEHRVLIAPVRFPKAGTYTFKLEQIMREDPLPHVLNMGIRIEKAAS